MNVRERTVGELIDELTKTNLKIWHFIEVETDEEQSMEARFNAGQTVIKLNKKRSELITAIDESLGHEADINPKTY